MVLQQPVVRSAILPEVEKLTRLRWAPNIDNLPGCARKRADARGFGF